MCYIWYIQQNIGYEIIDNFYNWLVIMAEKDFNELKFNSCQDFFDEYQNLIKSLLEKHESIKHDIRYKQFNADLVRRLEIIMEVTKEEYKGISNSNEKDMVYFNNLLGWYEDIPSETDMFIESLLSK